MNHTPHTLILACVYGLLSAVAAFFLGGLLLFFSGIILAWTFPIFSVLLFSLLEEVIKGGFFFLWAQRQGAKILRFLIPGALVFTVGFFALELLLISFDQQHAPFLSLLPSALLHVTTMLLWATAFFFWRKHFRYKALLCGLSALVLHSIYNFLLATF